MEITQEQLNSWYEHKSNKEQVIERAEWHIDEEVEIYGELTAEEIENQKDKWAEEPSQDE
jgi:hypothetical protein